MEVQDPGVQDELCGDPEALFWTVSLLVHLVLISTASVAHIQQPPDCECRVVVHDPGGWRGTGWRAQSMNIERWGQL